MNTPAHLIFGTAAFGKAGDWRITTAALAGSFLPDFSLYGMVGWSIFVKGVSPGTVFNEYYYSPQWQQVFAVDNSIVLWGLLLLIGVWAARPVLTAFGGAGLLHICFDFLLHNDDARMHFWPLSDWVFVSPFSYWDSRYHAGVIGPLELGVSMVLVLVLLRRYRAIWSRGLIAVLALLEIVASGFFRWFF